MAVHREAQSSSKKTCEPAKDLGVTVEVGPTEVAVDLTMSLDEGEDLPDLTAKVREKGERRPTRTPNNGGSGARLRRPTPTGATAPGYMPPVKSGRAIRTKSGATAGKNREDQI